MLTWKYIHQHYKCVKILQRFAHQNQQLACCSGGEPAVSPANRARGGSCPAPCNPSAPDRHETPSVQKLARRRENSLRANVAQLKQSRLKTLPIPSRTARLHGQSVLNSSSHNRVEFLQKLVHTTTQQCKSWASLL